MTSISKNVYIDQLDDIVNEHNSTYHKTIKMKPVDLKSDFYDECNVDSNDKDPKFQIGNHVRVSKYKKKKFAKGYTPNWVFNKIKNKVPWAYIINDLNGEEIIGIFYEKELQKKIEKSLK